jgi:hypothetical protein
VFGGYKARASPGRYRTVLSCTASGTASSCQRLEAESAAPYGKRNARSAIAGRLRQSAEKSRSTLRSNCCLCRMAGCAAAWATSQPQIAGPKLNWAEDWPMGLPPQLTILSHRPRIQFRKFLRPDRPKVGGIHNDTLEKYHAAARNLNIHSGSSKRSGRKSRTATTSTEQ